MNKYNLLGFSFLLLASAGLLVTSCSKDDNTQPSNGGGNGTNTPAEVKTVTSLEAVEKVYLNLTTGDNVAESTISTTNWDIYFYAKDRAIEIGVNSGSEGTGTAGAQLVETGFDDLKEAPESGYLPGKDATGDYLKWSTYTSSTTEPKHAILPKPGMTIAIKTADGKYAKLQIISLYKGNPNTSTPEFADLTTRPEFGYFTFRYAIQTNGGRSF